ncbi:MAG: SAM-dependent chlorinase/fluorinase [Thermoplasmata archaeon]
MAAAPRRPRLVTLSSDLGSAYSAQVKAVLVRTLPAGRIVELTHELPAHRVSEGAFLLRAMAQGFPAGTVHLAVVDPGVGGRRAPIAIACADGSRLVGPDNGLLYPLAEALGVPRAYRIDPARRPGPPRVGTTFDARDVFAPAAVRLALGIPPRALGPPVEPIPYRVSTARRVGRGAIGVVLHVDRFGNLITNIPSRWVGPKVERIVLRVGRRRIVGAWGTSYEALGRGSIGSLGSSFGTIEIARGQGNAARALGARPGASIEARWDPAARGFARDSIGK